MLLPFFNNNQARFYILILLENGPNFSPASANCLTDYTGRPAVFSLCGNLEGLQVLDVGCGEGYGSRKLKELGAKQVEGIDLSEHMIQLAIKQEQEKPLEINYQVGSATQLPCLQEEFDLAVAIFLYNYLNLTDTQQSFAEIFRVLKPQGRFLLAVPHPFFPYMHKFDPPSYFNNEGHNYFDGRDKLFTRKTWCLDGTELDVQLIHKTFEDYFFAIKNAGFTKTLFAKELTVTEDQVKINHDFFSPLQNIPLHAIFMLEK